MTYRLEYSTWLSDGDRRIIGEKEAKFLRLIKEGCSLSAAATSIGLDGEMAKIIVDEMEANSGTVLVARDIPSLTSEGERLLLEFECRRMRIADQLKHLYQNPVFTVDGIVIQDERILLVKRGNDPFAGMYALPGGYIDHGESAEEAVMREIEEETGLHTEVLDLVGAYTKLGRDPRGHICTLVYRLLIRGGSLRPGDDAAEISFFPFNSLPELAFDHAEIIADILHMYRKS